MFSVVIPLYNKELSIRNTLLSVLKQSYQNFEILVVNDGSIDGSIDAVKTINDERIRLINQENQGVSAARNRGIKEASYEWIAFLDGDDLWEKDHLIEYKNKIETLPSTNWLFSGFSIDNGRKRIEVVFDIDGKLPNIFDSFLSGAVIHTSTVCIKRSLFDTYSGLYFRTGLNNSEDREVWYKLACVDKSPVNIAKPLSIYKVDNGESLTQKDLKTPQDHFLTMQSRVEDFALLIPDEDKLKLFEYIRRFNRKSLFNRYKYGHFKKTYNEHLSAVEYFVLSKTIVLPFYLRFIISRALC